ncbi:DUF7831 domain-containing protein [Parachitinimonas caeni]|uniref:DUF7831 domain-containing protein n=1 Tax=Parachitinimonas caeni TaxID=3031301 RepID=A0ABT7E3E5_9NEIS|nr:hypothetical protein [Parachitinimonas caeni]MDK2126823.1 hypothetical protein [Parachitinimonas caeni]
MINIQILDEFYSLERCRAQPGSLFVFGDNLLARGKKGQAIIRDAPNSYGIPTKRIPAMHQGAFFSDQADEFAAVDRRIEGLHQIWQAGQDANGRRYDTLVFPAAGLGTGLARMPELGSVDVLFPDLVSTDLGLMQGKKRAA